MATGGSEIAPAITVLLMPKEPEESTALLRFQVQKANDPRDIYERGLAFLQADYFQQPKTFSDRLTAVLAENSSLATALIGGGSCMLEFDQFRQRYRLPCEVTALPPGDPAREASIWHNRIFNPTLPDTVRVVAFQPDWPNVEASPEPS